MSNIGLRRCCCNDSFDHLNDSLDNDFELDSNNSWADGRQRNLRKLSSNSLSISSGNTRRWIFSRSWNRFKMPQIVELKLWFVNIAREVLWYLDIFQRVSMAKSYHQKLDQSPRHVIQEWRGWYILSKFNSRPVEISLALAPRARKKMKSCSEFTLRTISSYFISRRFKFNHVRGPIFDGNVRYEIGILVKWPSFVKWIQWSNAKSP